MKKEHFYLFAFTLIVVSCAQTAKDSSRITNYSNNQMYHGIDVSNHQGDIDWSLVGTDKNIKFVYIKATEGATHIDKKYSHNIKKAKNNGLLVGSYHYLRNTSSILEQFMNFVSIADKDMQDLIPMIDVEEKVDKDSILLFCKLIEKHYGKLGL